MKKIIVALLGILLLCGCQQKVDIHNLDDFTGQNYEEVIAYLKENDIRHATAVIYSETIPVNAIISQELITVGENYSYVMLEISMGPEPVYIKSFEGKTEEELLKEVEYLDSKYSLYDYKIEYEESCEYELPVVTRQDIKYQTYAEPVTVIYTISKPADDCKVFEVSKEVIKNELEKPKTSKPSSDSNDIQTENKPSEKPTEQPVEKPIEQPKDENEYQVGDVIQTEAGNNLKYNGKIEKEDGTLGDSWTMIPTTDYKEPDTEKVVELEDGTKVTQEVINEGWEVPEDLPDGAVFVGDAEISDVEDFLNAQN